MLKFYEKFCEILPNERAWNDNQIDIQNIGSTINIKVAMGRGENLKAPVFRLIASLKRFQIFSPL